MQTTKDDRNEEQKRTHYLAVVARDKFMSGWGGARGGASRCAWAISPDQSWHALFDWVMARGDMRHVNLVDLRTYRCPRGTAHFHVYVAGPTHPAFFGR